jgi:hypothetical protein
VFNAFNMNAHTLQDVSLSSLDVGNLGDTGNTLTIPSMKLYKAGSSEKLSVSFNVPYDYVNTAGETKVVLHFFVKTGSGNVALRLRVINQAGNGQLVTSANTAFDTSIAVVGGNLAHYQVIFDVNIANLAAEDFIALAFYRIDSSDTYSDSLYVTSTEFRYKEA